MAKVSRYAADFLDLIKIILIIVALSSFVLLFALFLIKKTRESAAEQILKELGASTLQIYKISALSQLMASLTAIFFGFLLSFVIGFLMVQYFAYLNFAIAFDFIRILPISLLSEVIIIALYMLTRALSHLVLLNRKNKVSAKQTLHDR